MALLALYNDSMKNKIAFLIPSRESHIGIPVHRILPWAKKRMVGPFIFLDQMGPVLMKAPQEQMDVAPHPHIGLSTLTYLFEGRLMHRDSLGVEQLIVPGEVNWMTAGKGISHSEREPQDARSANRILHGLQFWVALPQDKEDCEPSFRHYDESEIPVVKNESLEIKVVAGNAYGLQSQLETHSPMTFLVMRGLKPGTFSFPHVPGHEFGVYAIQGELQMEETTLSEHEMAVLESGSDIEVQYQEGSLFAVIGGEPFPEKRFIFWNFVSSSQEKIEAAKVAWRDGSFPGVPGDAERIPLPGDAPKVVDYP